MRSVQWTAVPEAPVDKHRQFPASECDVDRASAVTWHWVLDSEPPAARMKGRSNRHLRGGVTSSIASHGRSSGGARRPRLVSLMRWRHGRMMAFGSGCGVSSTWNRQRGGPEFPSDQTYVGPMSERDGCLPWLGAEQAKRREWPPVHAHCVAFWIYSMVWDVAHSSTTPLFSLPQDAGGVLFELTGLPRLPIGINFVQKLPHSWAGRVEGDPHRSLPRLWPHGVWCRSSRSTRQYS